MQLCIGYGIWCALMNETIAVDLNDGEGSPSETEMEENIDWILSVQPSNDEWISECNRTGFIVF